MSAQLAKFTRVLATRLGVEQVELEQALRPCTQEEIAQVCALRRNVFGADEFSNDQQYLQWRYFSRDPDNPTLLVLHHRNAIIGVLGTEPIKVRVADKLVSGIKCTDAAVAPEYNGRGIGAWLNLQQFAKHDLVIAIGASEESQSMLNKLFDPMPIRNFYKYPIKPMHFLLGHHQSLSVLKPLAPLMDATWRAWAKFRFRSSLPSHWQLRSYSDVSELAAQLPTELHKMASSEIIRNPQYLAWRYRPEAGNDYTAMAISTGDQIEAFVIGKVTQVDSSAVGTILDWNFGLSESSRDAFRLLFTRYCLSLIDNEVDLIQLLLNDPASTAIVSELGFSKRGTDSKFFVHANKTLPSSVTDPSTWFVTLGDSDGA